jgi:hypothetical protein
VKKRPDGFFTKMRRFTPAENFALAEAMVLVVLAAPLLRFTPFRQIGRIASMPLRRAVTDPARQDVLIGRVAWAVSRAAKRSRLRAVCIERGVTAQVMLRRRGIDSTLYFGAAPNTPKGLGAHVWVVAKGVDVCGGEVAKGYAMLAAFPPAPTGEAKA